MNHNHSNSISSGHRDHQQRNQCRDNVNGYSSEDDEDLILLKKKIQENREKERLKKKEEETNKKFSDEDNSFLALQRFFDAQEHGETDNNEDEQEEGIETEVENKCIGHFVRHEITDNKINNDPPKQDANQHLYVSRTSQITSILNQDNGGTKEATSTTNCSANNYRDENDDSYSPFDNDKDKEDDITRMKQSQSSNKITKSTNVYAYTTSTCNRNTGIQDASIENLLYHQQIRRKRKLKQHQQSQKKTKGQAQPSFPPQDEGRKSDFITNEFDHHSMSILSTRNSLSPKVKKKKQMRQSSKQSDHFSSNTPTTWGIIQHNHDIRDNFTQLDPPNTSSSHHKLKKSRLSFPTITSKGNNNKRHNTKIEKLKQATRTPTMILRPKQQHQQNRNSSMSKKKITTFEGEMYDSSLATENIQDNSSNVWPRWKKKVQQQEQQHPPKENAESIEVDDNSNDGDTYLFGPEFLSNKKRSKAHQFLNKKDNIDIEEDQNDNDFHSSPMGNNRENRVIHNTSSLTLTPRSTKANEKRGHPTSAGSEYYCTYSNSPCVTRKRKRKIPGKLTRLLHSVRNSVESDWVRFQSGSYPYRDASERRLDVNDPRNRADTTMDITVLSPPVPFIAGADKVAILVYVNLFELNDSTIKTKNICLPKRMGGFRNVVSTITKEAQLEQSASSSEKKHRHRSFLFPSNAWLCFANETVKEHEIVVGSELRIYNAVVLNGLASFWKVPVILCTRLCEPSPRRLLMKF